LRVNFKTENFEGDNCEKGSCEGYVFERDDFDVINCKGDISRAARGSTARGNREGGKNQGNHFEGNKCDRGNCEGEVCEGGDCDTSSLHRGGVGWERKRWGANLVVAILAQAELGLEKVVVVVLCGVGGSRGVAVVGSDVAVLACRGDVSGLAVVDALDHLWPHERGFGDDALDVDDFAH